MSKKAAINDKELQQLIDNLEEKKKNGSITPNEIDSLKKMKQNLYMRQYYRSNTYQTANFKVGDMVRLTHQMSDLKIGTVGECVKKNNLEGTATVMFEYKDGEKFELFVPFSKLELAEESKNINKDVNKVVNEQVNYSSEVITAKTVQIQAIEVSVRYGDKQVKRYYTEEGVFLYARD